MVRPAAAPINVTLSADALFDFDKSAVKPAGQKTIDDELAKAARKGGNITVTHILIVGHTDSVGTKEYNQKLSVRRAEAVKAYIVSKGWNVDDITTEGKGKIDPIASNKTAAGRAQNRRVDITFTGTEPAPR